MDYNYALIIVRQDGTLEAGRRVGPGEAHARYQTETLFAKRHVEQGAACVILTRNGEVWDTYNGRWESDGDCRFDLRWKRIRAATKWQERTHK